MGVPEASTTLTRRRVLTLPIPALTLAVRFALLAELRDDVAPPDSIRAMMQTMLASRGTAVSEEVLDGWWPVLRSFACGWILQEHGS